MAGFFSVIAPSKSHRRVWNDARPTGAQYSKSNWAVLRNSCQRPFFTCSCTGLVKIMNLMAYENHYKTISNIDEYSFPMSQICQAFDHWKKFTASELREPPASLFWNPMDSAASWETQEHLSFQEQISHKKKNMSRWFKVPFSSPGWRSLNILKPLKGSLSHPKKGHFESPGSV